MISGTTSRSNIRWLPRRLLFEHASQSRSLGPHHHQSTAGRTTFARNGVAVLIARGDQLTLELNIEARDGTLARAGYAVVAVYPPNVKYVKRLRAAAAEASRTISFRMTVSCSQRAAGANHRPVFLRDVFGPPCVCSV